MTADIDQLYLASTILQTYAVGKGNVGQDDFDVGQLLLDVRLALKAVIDALLEILCIAGHLFEGALVGDHRRGLEILVAQGVAAVVIGVEQI